MQFYRRAWGIFFPVNGAQAIVRSLWSHIFALPACAKTSNKTRETKKKRPLCARQDPSFFCLSWFIADAAKMILKKKGDNTGKTRRRYQVPLLSLFFFRFTKTLSFLGDCQCLFFSFFFCSRVRLDMSKKGAPTL
nr:hypothetical protein [Pandoravirus aubagnensis]